MKNVQIYFLKQLKIVILYNYLIKIALQYFTHFIKYQFTNILTFIFRAKETQSAAIQFHTD